VALTTGFVDNAGDVACVAISGCVAGSVVANGEALDIGGVGVGPGTPGGVEKMEVPAFESYCEAGCTAVDAVIGCELGAWPGALP
jgi:hypothetical protein